MTTDNPEMPDVIWATIMRCGVVDGNNHGDTRIIIAHYTGAPPDESPYTVEYHHDRILQAKDAEIERLRKALEFYAGGDFIVMYGGNFYEWGQRNIDLQGTAVLGTKAREALKQEDGE